MPSSNLLSAAMESLGDPKLLVQTHRPRIFFRTFLLICFILLQFDPCLSGDTISLGHPIAGNQTITSEGGIFELGYFSRGTPARYYIGIWYKNITIDNVVWVANRDMPLQNNTAELKISKDGSNLVIQTKSGSPVWSTDLAPITASSHLPRVAVLLDNGNLALKDGNSSVWESFDHPTDTFLPSGRLGVNNVTKHYTMITSWKSKDDPSSGLFSQQINPNGDLELPLFWNNTHAYWTTGVWNGNFFSKAPEIKRNSSLYTANFVKNNNGSYYTYMPNDRTMLTKTKIDVNGQIKQLTWSKASVSWYHFWTRPIEQCDVYALCGPFGVCQPNSLDEKVCECFGGFEPASTQEWESNVWYRGCVRKNHLQCEGDQFSLLSINSSANLSGNTTVSDGAESCRSACLTDCFCTAYSYQQGMCSTWKGDVLNLVKSTTNGSADSIFVRVAMTPGRVPITPGGVPITPGKTGEGKKHTRSIVIPVSVASLVILLTAAGACYFWKSKAKRAGYASPETLFGEAKEEGGVPELPFYRLRDIMAATNNFSESNKLGQGGFGPVYRGELRGGQEVAIKRLSRGSKQGFEEFTNEVKLIAKLQHVNLVQLRGCCAEGEERILIYEYMPNKSLDHFLFDPILSKRLDWEKRLEIVIGIARGLQYLHQESRLKVIHRDLKTSNILLDAAMNPKISDFGLARIFGDEQSHISTMKVAGTCGYMPPEYAMEGRYSTKSDVFSFGVIVLEIVSGLRMTSFRNEEYSLNLLGHAWKLWNEDRVVELLHRSLGTPLKFDEVLKCVSVGLLCVQEDAGERPTMSYVVTMLSNDSANQASPKQPAYSRKARSPDGGSTPVEIELGNYSASNVSFSELLPR